MLRSRFGRVAGVEVFALDFALNFVDGSELFSSVFFIVGYFFLLLRRQINIQAANALLGLFSAGLLLLATPMILLALDEKFVDLLVALLLFIVGLLLAFVANARGGYFAGRKPFKPFSRGKPR